MEVRQRLCVFPAVEEGFPKFCTHLRDGWVHPQRVIPSVDRLMDLPLCRELLSAHSQLERLRTTPIEEVVPAVSAGVAYYSINQIVELLLQVLITGVCDLSLLLVPPLQDKLDCARLYRLCHMLRELVTHASSVDAREDERAALARTDAGPAAREARLAALPLPNIR